MKQICAVIALVGLLSACGDDLTDSPTSTAPPPEEIALPDGPVVAFMGDSITQYWGGGAPAYPTITITTLVPGSIDAGIAGQTTEQMEPRFASDVLAYNPAVVVILGGTNDLRLQESPDVGAIAAMAQAAAAAGVRVIIGTVPPSELWLGSTFLTEAETTPAIERFNAELRMLASAHGYTMADYYAAMVNPDGSPNESLFLSDHIHPNADGYAAMWGVLRPVLVNVEAQLNGATD
jgi:lysophospholipase L1-like esterase